MRKEIRNFAILAHIDHGKSTLADRFLEITHSVEDRAMREQYLDSMDLERERGITIKMQPVKMSYVYNEIEYSMNLIDTPGHVDFSYEVSRALAAVEGAILLIDATKGIQAQTVAHLQTAIDLGIAIVPVINKIDLPQARCEDTEDEILTLLSSFDFIPEKIWRISAKNGTGVEDLLQHIVTCVPPPRYDAKSPLRALIFDSSYDDYQGVIAHVRVMEGVLQHNEKIYFMASGVSGVAKDVGVFLPKQTSTPLLSGGDIGFVATGLKNSEDARIGDTITSADIHRRAHEKVGGYKEPQQLVFSTLFPASEARYEDLEEACKKLRLNDASLSFDPEHSHVLGRGMRAGFLGILHMEITLERLKREYGLDILLSSPSVVYRIETTAGEVIDVVNPSQYPNSSIIKTTEEPWVSIEVIVPTEYVNNAMNIVKSIRGSYKETEYLGMNRVRLYYDAALADIISGFYDDLKNATSGFGSLSYHSLEYRDAGVVKMDILLAGDMIEPLSRIVPRERVDYEARKMVEKIKNSIPREQFAVAIQAAVGGKVIARETKSAARKNVTAGLYGGDFSRKKKQLEKQKKGKKRLKQFGTVRLDSATLIQLFR